MSSRLNIDPQQLAAVCRRYHVRRLSLFGSVMRDDFHPGSDVDMLVDFDPEAHMGLLDLAAMQCELSELLDHPVHLTTSGSLSGEFRRSVLERAEVQYDAA